MLAQHNNSLKQAGEDFLALLEKSQLALDAVARKMDAEFSARYEKSGVNPLLLSKRIQKLSQQLPALKTECQTLIQRKQALVDAAKMQLLTNRTQLLELSSKSRTPVSDEPEVVADFAAAVAGWDRQAAQHNRELGDLPSSYMTREELNKALAGSMLAR